MGIEASLNELTSYQLKRIKKALELIEKWFFPEDGLLPKSLKKSLYEGLYLGRSLYGLNLLINGDPLGGIPPLSYAIFGKHTLLRDEMGFYWCKYLLSEEAQQVSTALARVDKEDLRENFDLNVLNEGVYPGNWEESDFDYLYDLFKKLLSYYRNTAKRQNAMIHFVF